MPESVTDRPTQAHEFVFLLAKSKSYYYDADAIADETAQDDRRGKQRIGYAGRGSDASRNDGDADFFGQGTHRNARSVWTVATKPYPGSHFAVMPDALAQKCVLAGSKSGDTVLDPFGGSGTVASVATGHGRNAIHIDLNPAYTELAVERIGPMLCDVKAWEAAA
jgi:DNA modification methylase